jgi:hypothetical protein
VEKAGPWDEELLVDQDGEYFARVLLQGCKVLFAKESRCTYTKPTQGNVSILNSSLKEKSLILSLKKSLTHCLISSYKNKLKKACIRRIRDIGYRLRSNYELVQEARKHEQKMWIYDLNLREPYGYNILCSFLGIKMSLALRNLVSKNILRLIYKTEKY